jgi:hypothetical protein
VQTLLRALGPVLVTASSIACAVGSQRPDARSGDDRAGAAEDSSDALSPSHEPEDPAKLFDRQPPPGGGSDAESSASFDLGVWCADRQVQASLDVERCQPALLGERPEDTLFCFRREELGELRVLYLVSLYVARAKRLVRLVELPYAAGPLAQEGAQPGQAYYVRLSAVVADDACTFELREDPRQGCAQAMNQSHDQAGDDSAAAVAQLIETVCAARGKYSATGRRLGSARGRR